MRWETCDMGLADGGFVITWHDESQGVGGTGGDTSSWAVKAQVFTFNDAPVVDAGIAGQSVDEDSARSFTVPADAFADADGDTLICSASLGNDDPLPSWLSFDAGTRTFSGTPPQDFNGAVALKVTASDGTDSVAAAFTLTVNAVNDAPTVPTLSALSVSEAAAIGTVVGRLSATDPDGDVLTYALTNSAGGKFSLVIEGGVTKIVVASALDHETASSHQVSDGNGGKATAIFTITVEDVLEPTIAGTASKDKLNGTKGDDIIFGYGRKDVLKGGAGDDILVGVRNMCSLRHSSRKRPFRLSTEPSATRQRRPTPRRIEIAPVTSINRLPALVMNRRLLRCSGAERLMAATGYRFSSRMGAPMHMAPSSFSPLSVA